VIVDGTTTIDLGNLQPDGSFTIEIPEGEHRLDVQARSGLYKVKSITLGANDVRALPVQIASADNRPLLITFEVTANLWRKASGRLPPLPDAAPVRRQVILGGPLIQNLQVFAGVDGSFEFPKLPPGEYIAFLQPLNLYAPSAEFVIGDKDVIGIELEPPQIIEIEGRVLTEDGSTSAEESTVIRAQTARPIRGLMGMVESVVSDKRLSLQLLNGDYRITTVRLPAGFSVRSMTYGGTDLLRQPLGVDGVARGPITITLARIDPASIVGFKIGGRVRMPAAAGTPRPSKVAFSGIDSGGQTFETPINADASFEFSAIPTGSYDARLIGPEIPAAIQQYRSRVVVENKNRSDVELTAVVWAEVKGQIIADGGAPLPKFKENSTSVQFAQDAFTVGDEVHADGSFRMALVRGDYQVSLLNLPAPYYLKSISSFETEFRQDRFTHAASGPTTMTITLGMRPAP
jgi:hypothetical protein